MTPHRYPAILAALFCLLLLPGCIFFNTGSRVRSLACSYVSVDVTRPKDGVVYVQQINEYRSKVYFQAPEVTFKKRPYLMTVDFMGASVTPVTDVTDTGAYRWVCMPDVAYTCLSYLDEDKASRGRCPAWDETDVSATYRNTYISILEEAPAPSFLAACRKEKATPHAAPITAEEFDPSETRMRMSVWYPAAFVASLPLSAADVGLSAIGSGVSIIGVLFTNWCLE